MDEPTLIRQIHYKYKIKGKTDANGNAVFKRFDINMYVDLSRFEKQYSRAQYGLDNMVMTSMIPFMPMETGTFINVTRAMSQAIAGSGRVYAAAPPFGRYLYYGKVMVDEATGSAYARPAARKVLVSQYTGKTAAKEDIVFSKARHPRVSKEWFEAAKRMNGRAWVEKARRIAGGGKKNVRRY